MQVLVACDFLASDTMLNSVKGKSQSSDGALLYVLPTWHVLAAIDAVLSPRQQLD